MQSDIWYLRPKGDFRFRMGHPWVMSNELQGSPKGIEPGQPIELRDAKGNFLAFGYGNPHSNIVFRELSRDPSSCHPLFDQNFFLHRLQNAWCLREQLGLVPFSSFRLIHGEGDFFPGLIVDRFLLRDETSQVFVLQAHTAGVDRLLPQLLQTLERWIPSTSISWDKTGIIYRNDLEGRKREGLAVEEPKLIRSFAGWDPIKSNIIVKSIGYQSNEKIFFQCNLLKGQKTGFFLDQAQNIEQAKKILLSRYQKQNQQNNETEKKEIEILDLFSYVGQWSTQLGLALKNNYEHRSLQSQKNIQLLALDASDEALQFTQENWRSYQLHGEVKRSDILQDLKDLKNHQFDIVICDPPALIKSRKDFPTGQQAYIKLNREAMKLVKAGGWIITCSCSGILSEEDFQQVLQAGARKSQTSWQWIARGFQSPDHPARMEFPEGRYLKMWMGVKR